MRPKKNRRLTYLQIVALVVLAGVITCSAQIQAEEIDQIMKYRAFYLTMSEDTFVKRFGANSEKLSDGSSDYRSYEYYGYRDVAVTLSFSKCSGQYYCYNISAIYNKEIIKDYKPYVDRVISTYGYPDGEDRWTGEYEYRPEFNGILGDYIMSDYKEYRWFSRGKDITYGWNYILSLGIWAIKSEKYAPEIDYYKIRLNCHCSHYFLSSRVSYEYKSAGSEIKKTSAVNPIARQTETNVERLEAQTPSTDLGEAQLYGDLDDAARDTQPMMETTPASLELTNSLSNSIIVKTAFPTTNNEGFFFWDKKPYVVKLDDLTVAPLLERTFEPTIRDPLLKQVEYEYSDPILSPDLNYVALCKHKIRTDYYNLCVMDLTSGNVTRLTDKGVYSKYLFTPDCKKVVFTDCRSIRLADFSGGASTTNNVRTKTIYRVPEDECYSPNGLQISKYGTKIVFCMDQPDFPKSVRMPGSNIYVVNIDGSDLKQLTFDSDSHNIFPMFNPRGDKIVYVRTVYRRTDRGTAGRNSKIYLIDTDGSNLTRLTDEDFAYWPVFTPDGERIVFSSERSGNSEIFVMNADGSGPVNLTNNNANDYRPVVSPDGSKIAFESNRTGEARLYVMDADGKNQEMLSFENADAHYAFFRGYYFTPMSIGNRLLDYYGNWHDIGD